MTRRPLPSMILCAALLGAATWSPQAHGAAAEAKPRHKLLGENVDYGQVSTAYLWLDIMQSIAARDVELSGARPTVLSRFMAIWATAVYDAWAAYDDRAVGTRFGGTMRRPVAERTLANKQKAISYASYHALVFLAPDAQPRLAEAMRRLGFDPAVVTRDLADPAGVGRLAAEAVAQYRRRDGANQAGDEPGGDGSPYGDYTFYRR